MKELNLEEVKSYIDNPHMLFNVENGNAEFYSYTNEEEKDKLLSMDWFQHSPEDKLVGLRKNGAQLSEKPKGRKANLTLVQEAHSKLTVKNISRETLTQEIRTYFKWRKGDMVERLLNLGTVRYDEFVSYLVSKGY